MEENVIGMPDSFFERLNKKNGFADDTTAAPVDSGTTPVATDKTIPSGMPDSFFEKLNSQQHYADTNNWAENYKRYIPQAEENPSAWDNIKNNFFAIKDASEASMYGGLELMSQQGEKSGNANFANFIKAAGMYYGADPNWLVKNMQENEAQSQEELKRVWLDPKMGQFNATDMFADPKSFFQTQLPQMLGGSATLMAAGMGIAKGVQTGVMAIGAAGAPFTFGGSAVAAGFIGGAVASAISRPIESLMEGYGAFDEAYSELAKKYPNATHQQLTDMAMPVFNKTFDENMQLQVLDAVQLGLSIIPVTAWGKGALSGTGAIGRMARRADMMRQRYNVAAHIGETAFQMGTGGWEEVRQMQITNEAINKYVGTDKPTSWYDMLNTKEGQSAVSGGSFMGGMMEAPGMLKLAYNKLTGVGDDIKTKPYEDIKQKQTALFYGNIAKSVNEGTTNEMMQAINKFGRSGVLATVETDDADSRNKSSIAEAKRLGDEVAEQVGVFSRMKEQYPDVSEKGLVRMFQNNALISNNTKALKTLSEDNVTDTPIIQRINAQNEALNQENNDILAGKDVWETPSHEDPFADPEKDKEADIPFDSVEEVEAARLKEIEALQQIPTDGMTDEQMYQRAESIAEINSRYEDLKNRLTEKINDAKGHYENQRVLTEMLQNNIPVEGTIQKAYGMHYDFVTQDGKTVRFYNQATHDVVDDNDFNGSAFLVLRKAEQGLDGTYKDEKGNYLFRSVLGDKDHAERIEVHTTDKDGNDKYLGNVAVSNAEDYNIARDRAKAARMEKLEGEDGEGEGFSVSDEQLSGVKTTSNEQAAEAQSYGFRNAYHALNSVNKYFDADYTDYANIPKEDLALVGRIKQEEAASATTTTPPPDSPPDSPPPSEPDTPPAPPTPPPTPPPAPQSPSPATAPSGTTSSTDSGNAGYERTERSFDKVNVGDNITHNGKQGKVFAKVRPKGSLSHPVVLAKDAEGKVFRVTESEYKGTERGESDNVLKTNGKLVSYRNDIGRIVVDEENNVIFEGSKSSVELGKTTDEEFAAKSIGDIGISYVNENSLDQAILVDNTVYVKGEQQELVRINYDKNGNVVSYTYKNSKGHERTNRNSETALDIAIQKNNQEFDKSRKGASDEVKQRDEEHISGVVKSEYGDSIGYILETMPDEVYDTFDLMESGVTSLEKDAIQYMVLRTIEALADARKRIEGSNATKKEKGSALSMIEKFEKDLNKYYGKLDKQSKVSAKNTAEASTRENNKGDGAVQTAEQEAETIATAQEAQAQNPIIAENDKQEQGTESAVQQSPDATGQVDAEVTPAVLKSSWERNIESLVNPTTGLSATVRKIVEEQKPYKEAFMKRVGLTKESYDALDENGKENVQKEWVESPEFKELSDLPVENNSQNQQPSKQVDAGTGNAAQSVETNPALRDVESKKADIERRRQEELKERVIYDRKPTIEDGEFRIIGDPNRQIYRINENTGRLQVRDRESGLWTVEGTHGKIELETAQRSGFEKLKENINAKYDAELEALSKPNTNVTTPTKEVSSEGNPALRAAESTAKALEASSLKFTDTPSLKNVEAISLEDANLSATEEANAIKTINQNNENKSWDKALRGDAKNVGNGWFKVGSTMSGESILYSPEQNKAIVIKGAKSDEIAVQDFVRNNFGNPKQTAEAYHKAKADGSNPELVKAVEELLDKPKETSTPQAEPKEQPLAEKDSQVEGNAEVSEQEEKEGVELGEKLQDFGEKIGMARKDTAESGFKRGGKKSEVPAWAKKYAVLDSPDGTFELAITKDRFFKTLKKGFKTREEAAAAMPLMEVASNHRVYESSKTKGEYSIYRRWSSGKMHEIKKGFKSREEAMLYMAKNAEEIINHKTTKVERPHLDKLERKGVPVRKGNVTPEQFMETFGFRGGEFGNWVTSDERQTMLNFAFDALMDMANVLGVSPRALSLGGRLAVGFGSRGKGLSGAAAHFESARGVINLTKIHGAGSLAHEWFHAFDSYFGIKGRKEFTPDEQGVIQKNIDHNRDYMSGDYFFSPHVRDAVKKAWKAVWDAMRYKTQMNKYDEAVTQRRLDSAQESLLSSLNNSFNYLKRDRQYGLRKKAATPQQVERFEKLIERIKGGDFGAITEKITKKKFSSEQEYEVQKALNALSKEISGREFSNIPFSAYRSVELAREEIQKAKDGVERKSTVSTTFFRDSKEIDKSRSSDYWSTNFEMAARAFESWVHDKMREAGGQNDYLVHSTNNAVYQMLYDAKPYPEGQERTDINNAFEKLFDVLEEAVDEKGDTVLFQSGEHSFAPITKQAFDKLVNGLNKAFGGSVKVFNDWGEFVKKAKEQGVSESDVDGVRFAFRMFSSRLMIPNVRGGWTKEKIIRYLKKNGSASRTNYGIRGVISSFDNAEDFANHIYYHGTENYIEKGLKPSITRSERESELYGGGGYGDRYYGVSLTKRKRTAETFGTIKRGGSVYPVILHKDANVITREDLSDASEIEDIIVDLYNQGVDAVWIGGGEQELVVINPAAVSLYNGGATHVSAYGGYKTNNLTDEQIRDIYQKAKNELLETDERLKGATNKEDRRQILDGLDKIQFLKYPDGTVYGAVLPDGSMYLNPEKLNANTPLHEHTHLFNQVIQHTNPKLWNRMVEAVKGIELWDEVKNDPNYANLKTDSQIADEVYSRLTGTKGAVDWQQRMAKADSKSPLGKIGELIKEFWNAIKDFFGADIYKNMTADDFANRTLDKLLSGKEIKGAKDVLGLRDESVGGESNSIKYQIEEFRDEPLASVNPALAEHIRQRMQRLFPSVALFSDKASFEAAAKKVSKGVTFSSAYIGAAIKNMVYVDAEKALQHTEIHEYAHIYWDALPADHPLKTALLDKFGGNEEATIDAIGRAGTIIMENELDIAKSGFFEKWLKKFWAAVKGVFTSKSIEQAFAERLLTNADLVTEENIANGVVKYMKMKSSAKYSELSEKAVKGIEKIIGKKISSLTFPEYYKHISTEIKPNDFKQWKMLSPQKFLEKMYGIVSPVSTLSPSNKAVFMKQYREYLDDYNWAENNVWTRFASGSMTLTVKEIEDLYMEAYKRKSYGTKDAVNFLADLYSKAVMYKNMQQEIKGDTFNKPFAKMSFDMMSGHEITDLSGSEFVSGKYSLLSPDRVKETILQGREKLYREVQRNATIKEDALKNDFDVIWKRVKDLKSDLRKIVDKTGTYFIDRNSSAYKALRGGTVADRALADLLDMHYKYESAYGGLSMEKGKYRVPVARMDFGGLAKKFGFKEGMRRYFAKPSKYDNVIIDVRSLGLSKPLMTLKQARQEMVKGSNAIYPFQMLKLTKKVDALTKEAYKQFNSGRHANGDIVTTEDLSGSRYGVSFVKDDESSEDLKVSMMLYHYANIENESYDLLSPYSMYIQKYLGRKDKPNMLKWVKMLDDDLIKGESPTSNLGVYAKYVQALTNYTHWLQLGFNIAGMPFNAFAGFAQSVREIGFRNTLRGLRRVIGSLTVGGGAGVVNAKAISIMEKLHIVSLSKDLEMSVTSKIGKGISKIAFLPVSFVEYINHAYSFIGAMDESEWERVKALPANASAEDYTKAMGGNERVDELHTLTQKINGAYSKYSRRGINKTAEGRALMQFKNWLPDVIFAHLTVSQLNEAGEDLYGEYQSGIATSIKNTVWNKTIIPMFKDKSIAQAKKNWETLSEHEQMQVGKAMRQLVILGGMALWIASLDDRDDKELKRMLRRAMGDVTYIFDVSNMQFLFDNTVPVFGTIKNLLGLVAEVFSTATGNPSVYEKRQGSHMRGDLKLPVMIENQTPVVNKISKLVNEGD